jgi:hypothetical protein
MVTKDFRLGNYSGSGGLALGAKTAKVTDGEKVFSISILGQTICSDAGEHIARHRARKRRMPRCSRTQNGKTAVS